MEWCTVQKFQTSACLPATLAANIHPPFSPTTPHEKLLSFRASTTPFHLLPKSTRLNHILIVPPTSPPPSGSIVSLSILRRDAVTRGVRSGIAGMWAVWGRVFAWLVASKSNVDGGVEKEKSESIDQAGSEGAEEGKGKQSVRRKRPFEFRERLWYESPEDLDVLSSGSYHDVFGHFDAVQKEFRKIGKHLQWRTGFLALVTEETLLRHYKRWAARRAGEGEEKLSNKEKAFYVSLQRDIDNDAEELIND